MTEHKIIAKLWSTVYDLLLYIEGRSRKSLDELHEELDVLEYACRPFAEDVYEEGGQN